MKTVKVIRDGEFIDVTVDGTVIGTWKKTMSSQARSASNGYYDVHRIAKGDTHEYSETVEFRGDRDLATQCVEAIGAQLPKSLVDAQFAFRPTSFQDRVWSEFEFLQGIAGGCAWYGNTPKKVVDAIKRVQKKGMEFTI